MSYKEIGGAGNAAGTSQEKLQQVVAGAQGAMNKVGGVLQPIMEKTKEYIPDTSNIYLEPLLVDPPRSLGERYELIMESKKTWSEFFKLSEFNLPPFSQIKIRLSHNIQSYFYNYFLLTLLHLCIFALFHFGSVFYVAVTVAIYYVLFISYPDDIHISSQFVINDTMKKVILGAVILFDVFFGQLFTLLFSVVIFVSLLVLVHGILRDDEDFAEPSSIPA